MDYRETHPGAILREELEARGLSAAALALRLRVAPQRIQEIVAGKRGITPESALRLGRYFGNEPETNCKAFNKWRCQISDGGRGE